MIKYVNGYIICVEDNEKMKIIVTAKTTDEAVENALKQLHTTADKFEYKVIEHKRNSSTIEAWTKEINCNNDLIQSKLRKCPDCGHDISRKASVCPNCGCPIEKTVTCPYCEYDTDLTYKEIQNLGFKVPCKRCGRDVSVSSPQEEQIWEKQKAEQSNTPKCPTCGSTNIEKISMGKKVMGGAMFGLFSSNVRNTMHCKKCGYKW